jgi:hypothetical protein
MVMALFEDSGGEYWKNVEAGYGMESSEQARGIGRLFSFLPWAMLCCCRVLLLLVVVVEKAGTLVLEAPDR